MTAAQDVAIAATFVWFGMVLPISFVETPLKFRAPGVTLPIGLGIGRLVFRALNIAEAVLAVIVAVAVLSGPSSVRVAVTAFGAVAAVVVQVGVVRPRLTRRTDRILAGGDASRSHSHHAYIALQILKAVVLLITGTLLLMA